MHRGAVDRASVDDLVRVVVARQEDLLLLTGLRRDPTQLPAAAKKRVTMECAFREEWRTGERRCVVFFFLNFSSVTIFWGGGGLK